MSRILHIQSSARRDGSVSREITNRLVRRLAGPDGAITVRDLAAAPPSFLDPAWVEAAFTDPDAHTPAQIEALAESERLIEELEAADEIIIAVPVYNFSLPAVLKAWIDHVARARRTFRYTEAGPEGLITGKTAWLVVASGGTELGGALDFATPYLKHVLGFIGITDVRVVDAGRWAMRTDAEKAAVFAQVDALSAQTA